MTNHDHAVAFQAIEKAVDFAIDAIGGIEAMKKMSMFSSSTRKVIERCKAA